MKIPVSPSIRSSPVYQATPVLTEVAQAHLPSNLKNINRQELCSSAEAETLVEWIKTCLPSLVQNGYNRRFKFLSKLAYVPAEVWDIRQRIIAREVLGSAPAPDLDDFVSHISAGGKIHPHTDPNRGDLIHIRFNVFLQLPLKGGRPIYADRRFDPAERAYLPCVAGRDIHTCELVEGDRPRMSLSYGFLVSTDWLAERGL